MKYKVIGVRDMLIKRFLPLQCVNDIPDEDIVESHRRAVLQKKIPAELAENYVLYRFGEFDDETGEITLESEPVFLVSLADYLPKPVKQEVIGDGEQSRA